MTPEVRSNFPLLSRRIDGNPLVYLDSAAMTLMPSVTIAAQQSFATAFTANVHRGASSLSEEASFHYESARHEVADFIGADASCVVMVPNTSFGLETIASGLTLTHEDVVLCSPNSHHSNLLPWLRRATVKYFTGDPLASLECDEALSAIKRHRPKVIALGWVSNVNGATTPVREICAIAREHGVISVVDAAQAAPHLTVDVGDLGCDFLVFSGHKVLGPTGTGVLWGRPEMLEGIEPLIVGGGTVDSVSLAGYSMKAVPYRLEAGTPNISGVIGLGAALQYLRTIGHERVETHSRALSAAMHDALSDIAGTQVLTSFNAQCEVPVASVVTAEWSISPDVICRTLSDSFGVMTRSGFHCAHPLFEGQGFAHGAVRFSAYIYNTVEDIQLAGQAMRELSRRFLLKRHRTTSN